VRHAQDQLLDLRRDLRLADAPTGSVQRSAPHPAVSGADGADLGHAGDLSEPLPSQSCACESQALAPRIAKAQGFAGRKLIPDERQFRSQVGIFSKERLVLSAMDGGDGETDEPGQLINAERQMVYGWVSIPRDVRASWGG
jgi:hypothetical protein